MGTLAGRLVRGVNGYLFLDDLSGNCYGFKTPQAAELAFHLRFFLDAEDEWKPDLMSDGKTFFVGYGSQGQDLLTFTFDGVKQLSYAFFRLMTNLEEKERSGIWLDDLTEEYPCNKHWSPEQTRSLRAKREVRVR